MNVTNNSSTTAGAGLFDRIEASLTSHIHAAQSATTDKPNVKDSLLNTVGQLLHHLNPSSGSGGVLPTNAGLSDLQNEIE